MTNKTKANWSQYANVRTPKNVVCTRKNTSFEDWKIMVATESLRTKYDGIISPLSLLHGWEFEETPQAFVETYISRERKIQSRMK